MTTRLRFHSAQAFLDILSRLGGVVDDRVHGFRAQLPGQLGTGTIENYRLQTGLEFAISRYRFGHEVSVEFLPSEPTFSFGCILEGEFDVRGRGTQCSKPVRGGQGMNMWASDGRYWFGLVPRSYVGLALTLDAEALEKLAEANMLPPELRRIVARNSFPVQVRTNSLSPAALEASRRVLSSSPDDPLRFLLVESCGLTLLREQLLTAWTPPDLTRPLSRRDYERVHAVRDLLLHHPERSPSLQSLAHEVGMNRFSLTQKFRMQFSESIYEFLRRQRMELAVQLLTEGEHSVADVAQAVGYKSAGRFAAAFQRQFGVTPKRHQVVEQHGRSLRSGTRWQD